DRPALRSGGSEGRRRLRDAESDRQADPHRAEEGHVTGAVPDQAVFTSTCFSNAAVHASTICCRSYGLQSSSTASFGPISSSSARLFVVVTTNARPCMTLEFRISRRKVQLVSYGGATS